MKLTEIVRKILEAYFKNEEFELSKETKDKYKDKRACFVTLTKDGELRGCIGSLEARQELWRDVQENAMNAAFNDSRFHPLTEDEFKEIKIEISILSQPKKLKAKNSQFLLDKIDKSIGLILRKDHYSSTFLPQVWEKIPNKEEFLEKLSLKAGLDKDEWKSSELWYYAVTIEEE